MNWWRHMPGNAKRRISVTFHLNASATRSNNFKHLLIRSLSDNTHNQETQFHVAVVSFSQVIYTGHHDCILTYTSSVHLTGFQFIHLVFSPLCFRALPAPSSGMFNISINTQQSSVIHHTLRRAAFPFIQFIWTVLSGMPLDARRDKPMVTVLSVNPDTERPWWWCRKSTVIDRYILINCDWVYTQWQC
jgi:hypothetical protein